MSRHTGALLGESRAAGGLLHDLPADLLTRREHVWVFNDFLSHSDFATGGAGTDTLQWIYDDIGTPAADAASLVADSAYGELLLNAGTTSSTGFQLQLLGGSTENNVGEWIIPADNKLIAFEARIKADTVANGSFVFGLMETDTTAYSAAGAVTVDNGFYFNSLEGVITASAERATNKVDSTATITPVDDTYVRLGMRCRCSDVSDATLAGEAEVYVNGVQVDYLVDATNGVIPNGIGLAPTFGVVNNASADIDATVDYFWVAMTR